MLPFADPLEFARRVGGVQTAGRRVSARTWSWRGGSSRARQAPGAVVFMLPDAAWARRASGTLANDMAKAHAGSAVAIVSPKTDGRLSGFACAFRAMSSVSAEAFCRRFPTGGGRQDGGGDQPSAERRAGKTSRRRSNSNFAWGSRRHEHHLLQNGRAVPRPAEDVRRQGDPAVRRRVVRRSCGRWSRSAWRWTTCSSRGWPRRAPTGRSCWSATRAPGRRSCSGSCPTRGSAPGMELFLMLYPSLHAAEDVAAAPAAAREAEPGQVPLDRGAPDQPVVGRDRRRGGAVPPPRRLLPLRLLPVVRRGGSAAAGSTRACATRRSATSTGWTRCGGGAWCCTRPSATSPSCSRSRCGCRSSCERFPEAQILYMARDPLAVIPELDEPGDRRARPRVRLLVAARGGAQALARAHVQGVGAAAAEVPRGLDDRRHRQEARVHRPLRPDDGGLRGR